MEQDNVILEIPCQDRKNGEAIYQILMLREFDRVYDLSPEKIKSLWQAFSPHKVLFSDNTQGKLQPFLIILLDPRGVWMEIRKKGDETPLGVVYVTGVKPMHEADGHFAFWDSIGSGREPLILFLTEWIMDRYKLHRLNAHIPAYQRGVVRFVERLGFTHEGTKREAILHNGERVPLLTYGILEQEVDERISKIW